MPSLGRVRTVGSATLWKAGSEGLGLEAPLVWAAPISSGPAHNTTKTTGGVRAPNKAAAVPLSPLAHLLQSLLISVRAVCWASVLVLVGYVASDLPASLRP